MSDLSELERLRDWKESAMDRFAEWDLVFEALGKPGPLGASMAANALAEVQRLKAEREKLPDSILAVAAALTVNLPEGWTVEADYRQSCLVVRPSTRATPRWFASYMKQGRWHARNEFFPSAQAAVDAITGRTDPTDNEEP